jgi:glycosyltransferase involved in cell wall biosynthesis
VHAVLAVVTPAKDEIALLPRLFAAMEAQQVPIDFWVIVDDDSSDGTAAFLDAQQSRFQNVRELRVLHQTGLPPAYALGTKYSMVVQAGFQALEAAEQKRSRPFDFVALLDADVFPAPDYFARLLSKFEALPRLGIASGVLTYETPSGLRPDALPMRWPRGGSRVWRRACLRAAPYCVSTSADAVSAARAWSAGWHCQAFRDCRAVSRQMGDRIDPKYYGASAYRLHVPFTYFVLKSMVMLVRDGPAATRSFCRGYLEARAKKTRQALPPHTADYFRQLPWRNLVETLIVYRNCQRLKAHQPTRGGPGN